MKWGRERGKCEGIGRKEVIRENRSLKGKINARDKHKAKECLRSKFGICWEGGKYQLRGGIWFLGRYIHLVYTRRNALTNQPPC
jgi:hypothetical protein